jgi:hypothetical protein
VLDVGEAQHDCSQELPIDEAVAHLLEQKLRHESAGKRQVRAWRQHRSQPFQAGDAVLAAHGILARKPRFSLCWRLVHLGLL